MIGLVESFGHIALVLTLAAASLNLLAAITSFLEKNVFTTRAGHSVLLKNLKNKL